MGSLLKEADLPITLSRYSAVVASINDATINPLNWSEALSEIRTLFGANGAHLLITPPNMHRAAFMSYGCDALQLQQYDEYYWRIDPVVPQVEHTIPGTILTSRDDTSPEQQVGEFFNDWAHPNEVGDAVFVNLIRSRLGVGATVCLGAQWRSSPFLTSVKIRLLKLLVPHLQHALKVQFKLGGSWGKASYSLQTLDYQRHGIVLIGHAGNIVHMNRAAEAIVARDDGLRISGGKLVALGRIGDSTLCSIIRNSTRASKGGLRFAGTAMIPRPSGRRPFMVVSLPLSDAPFGPDMSQASAMVQLVDPEREVGISPLRLQETFGLTPSEANVAIQILRGCRLQEIAKDLSVTLSTIRIHLQRVFEKTQTHRQADLIRLLLDVESAISKS